MELGSRARTLRTHFFKSLQNNRINKNMTTANKGSVRSADKSDNPLPSVNELSSYTEQELRVLEIATQGFSLKATAALLGQSEDQVALESPEDWYVGREEGSGHIWHESIRALKDCAYSADSAEERARCKRALREFWDKTSKHFNDTKMDIH